MARLSGPAARALADIKASLRGLSLEDQQAVEFHLFVTKGYFDRWRERLARAETQLIHARNQANPGFGKRWRSVFLAARNHAIRARYAAGNISYQALSMETGLSKPAIQKILGKGRGKPKR
jgi:hypothetical protein